MKKFYPLFAAALMLLLFNSIPSRAQLQFKNIASPNYITALAEEGNFIWVGTSNGLYKRNKSNGQIVSYFNKDNGLVNNAITAIAVDGQGNKWIGTSMGLSKFNEIANTWTSFLPGEKISSIAISLSSQKWIATDGGNLYLYDGTTWKTFNSMNSFLPNDGYSSLAFDDQNNLWIGTWHNGVCEFMSDTVTVVPYNYFPDSTIISIAIDALGNKWFGTSTNGLIKFYGMGYSVYDINPPDSIAGNSILSICADALNNIWIGTLTGVSKIDGAGIITNYHTASGLADEAVNSIIPDIQGNIWFGSAKGLSRFNGSLPMQTYFISNSIIDSYVHAIKKTSSSEFWFATNGGISKYNDIDNTWTSYTVVSALYPDPIRLDVDFGPFSTIWTGSPDGAWKYDGNTWTHYSQPSYTSAIAVDLNYVVWCGGATGLWSYDGTTWTNYNTGNSGIISDMINDIFIDNSNRVWIAANGGISVFDGSTWKNYTNMDGLLDNTVHCITIDLSGNIWAGTGYGISVFNGTSWNSYNSPFYDAETIAADNYGNKWIGTYDSGIEKFDGAHWAHFDNSKGLAGNMVNSIMIDDYNNKWIGTRTGVSKASCYNLTATFTTDTVCLPPLSMTTFINTTQDTDATTYFLWDVDYDGFYDYLSHDLQYQFPNYGIHKVSMMAVNDNCVTTSTNEVVVGSLPIVSLNYSGNINLCQGNGLLLESTINNYDTVFSYTYEWNHNPVNNSSFYADTTGDYFVTVHNATCIGHSDTVHVNLLTPYANQQICMVTVDTLTGKNLILWENTPNAEIEYYNIYKETAANVYQPIGNVSATQPGKFIDVNSDATIKSDRYKISILDSCYNESALSPEHKTMHLNVNLAPLNRHNLIWENYEGFAFGKYYIYRSTQPHSMQLLDSIQSTITSYTDTSSIPGSVYYLIVIKKTDTCNIGSAKDQSETYNTSVSNMEEYQIQGFDESLSGALPLLIYPNPFSNETTIEFDNPTHSPYTLSVMDVSGRLVSHTQNIIGDKFIFNRKELNTGFYMIELGGEKIFRGHFIID